MSLQSDSIDSHYTINIASGAFNMTSVSSVQNMNFAGHASHLALNAMMRDIDNPHLANAICAPNTV